MTEAPGPAEMEIRPPRRPFLAGLSVVWLVPVLALAVSLAVAWKAYSDRGALIEIRFANASGVTAGQTVLRYRDVEVGQVEDVSFTADLSQVLVSVRIDKELLPYLDDTAQFWVIRPEVSTRGITGLSTVLSGVYIEGNWDLEPGEPRRSFDGLDQAPLATAGEAGTRIELRARSGGLFTPGTPLLYRGIEVGHIEAPHLSEQGDFVIMDAFVEAPYDRRLTTASRFWDISGFNVTLSTGGIELDVSSLAALVQGGIAFDTVFSGGAPVEDGQRFDIFDSEDAARESIFSTGLATEVKLSLEFFGSVSGLTAGAPVKYRGVKVGEVSTLSVYVDEAAPGGRSVTLLANIAVEPGKLGLPETASEAATLDFLDEAVAAGLRARVATASLLTGTLQVELAELPDAPPAEIDRDAEPYPRFPTVEAQLSDFTATAEGVFERINALPVEELMQAAIDLMQSLERVASDENTVALPGEARALIGDARAVVTSEDAVAIPGELRAAIADLRDIAASLREADVASTLAAAVADLRTLAGNAAAASERLPSLAARLDALTAKAEALELEELIATATQLMQTGDALLGSDEAAGVPPKLAAALDELRGTLAAVRESGTIDNANAALASARAAADQISASATGVPALVERLDALAAKAEALPLDALVAETTDFVTSAEALIGTEEARAVPPALSAALDELKVFLAEVREGGALDNANGALASAEAAADEVARAASELPALVDRLQQLAANADAVVGAYGERSRFNNETLEALREVRRAAEAVASLSRTLERKPNSILIGR